MKWLRKLLGTDFPDPAVGQVWRSRHSGRSIRIVSRDVSDCGRFWNLGIQHETRDGINPIAMHYCLSRGDWQSMLHVEGRALE